MGKRIGAVNTDSISQKQAVELDVASTIDGSSAWAQTVATVAAGRRDFVVVCRGAAPNEWNDITTSGSVGTRSVLQWHIRRAADS